MGDKRKKVVVTMEEKLRAIQRLDSGVTAKTIALELGVGKSTVGDWKKNRAEIEKWCAAQPSESGMDVRKTMLKGKHKEVEEALFLWYKHLKRKGLPVSGQMLQEKALQFKRQIEGEDSEFTASDGWLDRWKKRFSIHQITTTRNALCAENKLDEITDNDIVEMVTQREIKEEKVMEKEEASDDRKTLIPHSEGFKLIEAALQYISEQEEATPADIICLHKWRTIASQKMKGSISHPSKTKFQPFNNSSSP